MSLNTKGFLQASRVVLIIFTSFMLIFGPVFSGVAPVLAAGEKETAPESPEELPFAGALSGAASMVGSMFAGNDPDELIDGDNNLESLQDGVYELAGNVLQDEKVAGALESTLQDVTTQEGGEGPEVSTIESIVVQILRDEQLHAVIGDVIASYLVLSCGECAACSGGNPEECANHPELREFVQQLSLDVYALLNDDAEGSFKDYTRSALEGFVEDERIGEIIDELIDILIENGEVVLDELMDSGLYSEVPGIFDNFIDNLYDFIDTELIDGQSVADVFYGILDNAEGISADFSEALEEDPNFNRAMDNISSVFTMALLDPLIENLEEELDDYLYGLDGLFPECPEGEGCPGYDDCSNTDCPPPADGLWGPFNELLNVLMLEWEGNPDDGYTMIENCDHPGGHSSAECPYCHIAGDLGLVLAHISGDIDGAIDHYAEGALGGNGNGDGDDMPVDISAVESNMGDFLLFWSDVLLEDILGGEDADLLMGPLISFFTEREGRYILEDIMDGLMSNLLRAWDNMTHPDSPVTETIRENLTYPLLGDDDVEELSVMEEFMEGIMDIAMEIMGDLSMGDEEHPESKAEEFGRELNKILHDIFPDYVDLLCQTCFGEDRNCPDCDWEGYEVRGDSIDRLFESLSRLDSFSQEGQEIFLYEIAGDLAAYMTAESDDPGLTNAQKISRNLTADLFSGMADGIETIIECEEPGCTDETPCPDCQKEQDRRQQREALMETIVSHEDIVKLYEDLGGEDTEKITEETGMAGAIMAVVMEILQPTKCEACNGRGTVGGDDCPECEGGRVGAYAGYYESLEDEFTWLMDEEIIPYGRRVGASVLGFVDRIFSPLLKLMNPGRYVRSYDEEEQRQLESMLSEDRIASSLRWITSPVEEFFTSPELQAHSFIDDHVIGAFLDHEYDGSTGLGIIATPERFTTVYDFAAGFVGHEDLKAQEAAWFEEDVFGGEGEDGMLKEGLEEFSAMFDPERFDPSDPEHPDYEPHINLVSVFNDMFDGIVDDMVDPETGDVVFDLDDPSDFIADIAATIENSGDILAEFHTGEGVDPEAAIGYVNIPARMLEIEGEDEGAREVVERFLVGPVDPTVEAVSDALLSDEVRDLVQDTTTDLIGTAVTGFRSVLADILNDEDMLEYTLTAVSEIIAYGDVVDNVELLLREFLSDEEWLGDVTWGDGYYNSDPNYSCNQGCWECVNVCSDYQERPVDGYGLEYLLYLAVEAAVEGVDGIDGYRDVGGEDWDGFGNPPWSSDKDGPASSGEGAISGHRHVAYGEDEAAGCDVGIRMTISGKTMELGAKRGLNAFSHSVMEWLRGEGPFHNDNPHYDPGVPQAPYQFLPRYIADFLRDDLAETFLPRLAVILINIFDEVLAYEDNEGNDAGDILAGWVLHLLYTDPTDADDYGLLGDIGEILVRDYEGEVENTDLEPNFAGLIKDVLIGYKDSGEGGRDMKMLDEMANRLKYVPGDPDYPVPAEPLEHPLVWLLHDHIGTTFATLFREFADFLTTGWGLDRVVGTGAENPQTIEFTLPHGIVPGTLDITAAGDTEDGWPYRRQLTVRSGRIDEDLTDYPVLVNLSADNFDFDRAGADGHDLRFRLPGGEELDFERVSHDAAGEEAEYWVKLPHVSSSENTVFYMYYGNPDAPDGENPEEVWHENFMGVWHKDDYDASTIHDSTPNANHGFKTAADQPQETDGIIGRAQEYDGVDDRITTGIGEPDYLGRFSNNDIFPMTVHRKNGDPVEVNDSGELADAVFAGIGGSVGTNHNTDADWLMFNSEGSMMFRPKESIRYGISWDAIYEAGAVYGTGEDISSGEQFMLDNDPGHDERITQDTRVFIDGDEYRVRLMRGTANDPQDSNQDDDADAIGSEWNALMLPIHEYALDDDWPEAGASSTHHEGKTFVEEDGVTPVPHSDGSGSEDMFTDDDLGTTGGINSIGSYAWCQEVSDEEDPGDGLEDPIVGRRRVTRGGNFVNYLADLAGYYAADYRGWVPVLESVDPPFADTFVFEAWVSAEEEHEIDEEDEQYGGTSGQKYVFGAPNMGANYVGAGLSVGINGISVYEHGSGYMPPMAVYEGHLGTGWNHIAVYYYEKQPFIFLNGSLVHAGLADSDHDHPRERVLPPYEIGSGQYGAFKGLIDETRVWVPGDIDESMAQIRANYEAGRNNLLSYGAEETVNELVALDDGEGAFTSPFTGQELLQGDPAYNSIDYETGEVKISIRPTAADGAIVASWMPDVLDALELGVDAEEVKNLLKFEPHMADMFYSHWGGDFTTNMIGNLTAIMEEEVPLGEDQVSRPYRAGYMMEDIPSRFILDLFTEDAGASGTSDIAEYSSAVLVEEQHLSGSLKDYELGRRMMETVGDIVSSDNVFRATLDVLATNLTGLYQTVARRITSLGGFNLEVSPGGSGEPQAMESASSDEELLWSVSTPGMDGQHDDAFPEGETKEAGVTTQGDAGTAALGLDLDIEEIVEMLEDALQRADTTLLDEIIREIFRDESGFKDDVMPVQEMAAGVLGDSRPADLLGGVIADNLQDGRLSDDIKFFYDLAFDILDDDDVFEDANQFLIDLLEDPETRNYFSELVDGAIEIGADLVDEAIEQILLLKEDPDDPESDEVVRALAKSFVSAARVEFEGYEGYEGYEVMFHDMVTDPRFTELLVFIGDILIDAGLDTTVNFIRDERFKLVFDDLVQSAVFHTMSGVKHIMHDPDLTHAVIDGFHEGILRSECPDTGTGQGSYANLQGAVEDLLNGFIYGTGSREGWFEDYLGLSLLIVEDETSQKPQMGMQWVSHGPRGKNTGCSNDYRGVKVEVNFDDLPVGGSDWGTCYDGFWGHECVPEEIGDDDENLVQMLAVELGVIPPDMIRDSFVEWIMHDDAEGRPPNVGTYGDWFEMVAGILSEDVHAAIADAYGRSQTFLYDLLNDNEQDILDGVATAVDNYDIEGIADQIDANPRLQDDPGHIDYPGEYYRDITIDHRHVDEELEDHPVQVELDQSNFDFGKARSDGLDVHFMCPEGTELDFQRVSHGSTSAEYRVRLPEIYRRVDTAFDMFYGDPNGSYASTTVSGTPLSSDLLTISDERKAYLPLELAEALVGILPLEQIGEILRVYPFETLWTEDFEGSFPPDGWERTSNLEEHDYEYIWERGQVVCLACDGSGCMRCFDRGWHYAAEFEPTGDFIEEDYPQITQSFTSTLFPPPGWERHHTGDGHGWHRGSGEYAQSFRYTVDDEGNWVDSWLLTPWFSYDPEGEATLTFNDRRAQIESWSDYDNRLRFEYRDDPGVYHEIENLGDPGTSWSDTTVNLHDSMPSNYNGEEIRLVFHFRGHCDGTYEVADGVEIGTGTVWQINTINLIADVIRSPLMANAYLYSEEIHIADDDYMVEFEENRDGDYHRNVVGVECVDTGEIFYENELGRAPQNRWRTQRIDLGRYAGETVRVFFNYQGAGAGTWYIDTFTLGAYEDDPLDYHFDALEAIGYEFIDLFPLEEIYAELFADREEVIAILQDGFSDFSLDFLDMLVRSDLYPAVVDAVEGFPIENIIGADSCGECAACNGGDPENCDDYVPGFLREVYEAPCTWCEGCLDGGECDLDPSLEGHTRGDYIGQTLSSVILGLGADIAEDENLTDFIYDTAVKVFGDTPGKVVVDIILDLIEDGTITDLLESLLGEEGGTTASSAEALVTDDPEPEYTDSPGYFTQSIAGLFGSVADYAAYLLNGEDREADAPSPEDMAITLQGTSVHIPDHRLREAIGFALLEINPDLTEAKLEDLYSLSAVDRGIKDLTGLEYAINLEFLDLSGNELKSGDLDPLLGLNNLKELHLSHNHIVDISSLADAGTNLENLEELDLSHNYKIDGGRVYLYDLTPLTSLQSLERLKLAGNDISNLSPLTELNGLKWLDLSHNQVNSFGSLAGLTELQVLNLSGNNISGDISDLSAMTDLERLDISGEKDNPNGINDISDLHNLANLRRLNLSFTAIGDGDLQDLDGLADLEELLLSGNGITNLEQNGNGWLAGLENLRKLDVSRNEITHIGILEVLIPEGAPCGECHACEQEEVCEEYKLEELNLAHNEGLSNGFEIISDMLNLSRLNLSYAGVGNATLAGLGLPEMPELNYLYLQGNGLSDLAPLEGLVLKELDLSNNEISDLGPLSEVTFTDFRAILKLFVQLEDFSEIGELEFWDNEKGGGFLDLSGNQVSDISSLAGKDLHSLDLSSNLLDGESIGGILDINFGSFLGGGLLDLSSNEIEHLNAWAVCPMGDIDCPTCTNCDGSGCSDCGDSGFELCTRCRRIHRMDKFLPHENILGQLDLIYLCHNIMGEIYDFNMDWFFGEISDDYVAWSVLTHIRSGGAVAMARRDENVPTGGMALSAGEEDGETAEGATLMEDGTEVIEGATVTVQERYEGGEVVATGVTDEEGKFEVGVPGGNYLLRIEHLLFETAEMEIEVDRGGTMWVPEKDVGAVEMKPLGLHEINLIARDVTGRELSEAVIKLIDKETGNPRASSEDVATMETSEEGVYTLAAPEGSFRLEADHPGFLPLVIEDVVVNEDGDLEGVGEALVLERYGDVLNNGAVSIADVMEVLRHAAGLDALDEDALRRARVSVESEEVGVRDAVLILQMVVGLLDEFPIENIE